MPKESTALQSAVNAAFVAYPGVKSGRKSNSPVLREVNCNQNKPLATVCPTCFTIVVFLRYLSVKSKPHLK